MYEQFKQMLPHDAGFGYKMIAGGLAGSMGGFLGAPPDIVNVRMQNDSTLPPEKRRK